jgi:hypothetical protein
MIAMPLRKSFADAIKIVNLTAAPSFGQRRVEGNEGLAEIKPEMEYSR